MRTLLSIWVVILFTACNTDSPTHSTQESKTNNIPNLPAIVIHGGAGYMTPENLSDSLQQLYHQSLNKAVQEGYQVLEGGGTALQAVEVSIRILENNPLFNAGKGSVLNANGEVENDASIMDGTTLMAGAVASVQNVKNPISLARLVKDSTKHVILSGKGALYFGKMMNAEIVNQDYFLVPETQKKKQEILEGKHGTVGCVAIDKNGNIAAGTSTGGMMNKKYGRIGDSPIIAAGTYANSNFAGVSCTGHGEYFIKNAVAYDVIARIDYKGESLKEATRFIVHNKLKNQKANGGLIALDKYGSVSMETNTSGMFRAFMNQDTIYTGIFN